MKQWLVTLTNKSATPPYRSSDHEMFLRGLPHLCQRMKRPSSEEIHKIKREPKSLPVPDLYALSRDNPLPEVPGISAPAPANGVSSAATEVTNSASSYSATMGNFAPVAQGVHSAQFPTQFGMDTTAGLGIFLQQMNTMRAVNAPATVSSGSITNGMSTADLFSFINSQRQQGAPGPAQQQPPQQQQQQQVFPNAAMLSSTGSGNGGYSGNGNNNAADILALLRQQSGAPLTQAQPPPPASATLLPGSGTTAEQVLALLRQRASSSAPVPMPVPSTTPPSNMIPALLAALLSQHNSNSGQAATRVPMAAHAAPGVPDLSSFLQQVQARPSASAPAPAFHVDVSQQAPNNNVAVLLAQLSQHLGAGSGGGGGGGGAPTAQEAALLLLMQGRQPSSQPLSPSMAPVVPPPPPPQAPAPPSLPAGLNIQELLRQLSNVARNNGSSNNNNNNRHQSSPDQQN